MYLLRGIFDFFRRDPSTDWKAERDLPIVLDLREMSLNQRVRLGGPASELEYFGRPSNRRPFREHRFLYCTTGVAIEIERDRVSYFGLLIVKDEWEGIGNCRPDVVFPDGSRKRVDDSKRVDELLAELPPPEEIDRDEDETVYTLSLRGSRLEIECSPEGLVRRINLFPEDTDETSLNLKGSRR